MNLCAFSKTYISRLVCRRFRSPSKMDISSPTPNFARRRELVRSDGSSSAVVIGTKVGYSTPSLTTEDTTLKQPDSLMDEEWPSLSDSMNSISKGKRKTKVVLRTCSETRSVEEYGEVGSSQLEPTEFPIPRSQEDENSLPTSFGKKFVPSGKRKTKVDLRTCSETRLVEESGKVGSSQREASEFPISRSQKDEYSLPTSFGKKLVHSIRRQKSHPNRPVYEVAEPLPVLRPFDICFPKRRKSFSHEKNVERTAAERSWKETSQVLRPGMVLLKSYITPSEQIEIVNKCRELGLGPGGFYQPCYRSGAKLHLQMMCLGLNWDPETRKYYDRRPFDGSQTLNIPYEFSLLVERAIQDSHDFIKEGSSAINVEDVLPAMSPNICIVNFYMTSGRLGLHQDRDESKESLDKGLPVVSFSVGDSAEFLYGDQRDVDEAEKVLLESGDVLIFGGESRHIFHGVESIIPNSAPPAVLEETKLRPGRLNLTFRQY